MPGIPRGSRNIVVFVCAFIIYVKYMYVVYNVIDTDVVCLNSSQSIMMKYSLFIFKKAVYKVLKFCQEYNQKTLQIGSLTEKKFKPLWK